MSSIFLGVRIQRQRRRNPFAPETSMDGGSIIRMITLPSLPGYSWFILVFLAYLLILLTFMAKKISVWR